MTLFCFQRALYLYKFQLTSHAIRNRVMRYVRVGGVVYVGHGISSIGELQEFKIHVVINNC